MWVSASRSRWAVETPGLSSSSTIASTSATTRPARRIRSISARDFRVTTSGVRGGGAVLDHGQQVREDVVDRLEAIDATQDPGRGVVVDDFPEARQLEVEARADRLGLVIVALVERRAIDVAGPRLTRRVARLVVHVTRFAAEPTARHAAEDLLVRDLDERCEVDSLVALGQGVVERLRLRAVAWEPVEDRAVRSIRLREPVEQHPDR